MSEDWAEKKATEIYNACDKSGFMYPNIITMIALALKQEREIATLEMESKWKKIDWPSDEIISKKFQESWENYPSLGDEQTLPHRKGYMSGFYSCLHWLREYVESRRR